MHDWTDCPEADGPLTEPPLLSGRGFDHYPESSGPAADRLVPGSHTVRIGQAPLPSGPDERECMRPEIRAHDTSQAALRARYERAARFAGADQFTARRTADELMRQASA